MYGAAAGAGRLPPWCGVTGWLPMVLRCLLVPQVSWAHIDMAGPVWDDKAGGATGYGAQLLAEWAINQGQ